MSTSEQYTVSKVTSKLTLNAKFELIKYKVNAQAVTDETIAQQAEQLSLAMLQMQMQLSGAQL